ncbi:hypothetical protein, partial [Reinekea sp.]|uniref:hypothetical protein n=1 Tax=Reinekea sp. TaxID=1970455 RepID=UPI00398968B7
RELVHNFRYLSGVHSPTLIAHNKYTFEVYAQQIKMKITDLRRQAIFQHRIHFCGIEYTDIR